MSSLWRQSRSLKNESKLSSATINKSKEPKGPVYFFDFIKQWWIFITIGSYLFMVSVLVYAYTDIFSGDIVNAIDYVQYYVINNSYRVILFLVIAIIPISLFFYPWFSLSYMVYKETKGENKNKFEKFYKLINMYIKSFGPIWVISIVLAILYYILSLSSYSTTYRNGNQILSSDIEKKCFFHSRFYGDNILPFFNDFRMYVFNSFRFIKWNYFYNNFLFNIIIYWFYIPCI